MSRFNKVFSIILIILIQFSGLGSSLPIGMISASYASENTSNDLLSDDSAYSMLNAVSKASGTEGNHVVNNTPQSTTYNGLSSILAGNVYAQADPPGTDDESVELDAEWLVDEGINEILENNTCSTVNVGNGDIYIYANVINDLIMPAEGYYGSTIQWTSDMEHIIGVDGTVARPDFRTGDAWVYLHAEISTGDASSNAGFIFIVPALPRSSEENTGADLDAEWLKSGVVLDQNEAEKVEGAQINKNITSDLYLPSEGEHGSTITWIACAPEVIDENGSVTRPAYGMNESWADMEATVTNGDTEITLLLSFTVSPLPPGQAALDVEADAQWLTAERILQNNNYIEDETGPIYRSVTEAVYMPEMGPNGSIITWTSDQEDVIRTDGTVIRPDYGQQDSIVNIAANIKKENIEKTVAFMLEVSALRQPAELDAEWLTAEVVFQYNQDTVVQVPGYYANIVHHLYMPDQGPNGSAITWTSTNTEVINTDGTVNRPGCSTGNTLVSIQAAINMNGIIKTVYYTVQVLALPPNDTEKVQMDAQWLTDERIYGSNAVYIWVGSDRVLGTLGNLYLPVKGANGCDISWESSDETKIATDGTVKRSVSETAGSEITITATISSEGSQSDKSFNIFLLNIPSGPATDEERAMADETWLTEFILTGGGTPLSLFSGSKLNLHGTGLYGSTINWTSSDTETIAPDGTITTPAFTMGNRTVTLTAGISNGTSTVKEKSFTLSVMSNDPTSEEVVEHIRNWLTDELILSGNSADDVKTQLYLPVSQLSPHSQSASRTVDIEWQSSSPDVIAAEGAVCRTSVNQEYATVRLTAAISFEGASGEKTFDFTVKKAEEASLAINYDDFNGSENSLKFNGGSALDAGVLQFDNPGHETGESVITQKKLHLNDELSFSTGFSFKIGRPNGAEGGEGGFDFVLQNAGNDISDMAAVRPNLSIHVGTVYTFQQGPGQQQGYRCDGTAQVYCNGNRIGDGFLGFGPDQLCTVWVEYDGSAKTIDLSFNFSNQRPYAPRIHLEDVDLTALFMSAGDSPEKGDVQEVYAGFTGSHGDALETIEIHSWYFKNDPNPIEPNAYILKDASVITLSANPEGGQSYSTVTASVHGRDGMPAAGIPVDFSTASLISKLDKSSAVTDSEGQASVTVSADEADNPTVKVVASGGSMALTAVNLILTDEDMVNADSTWLTDARILGTNSALDKILTDLELPEKGLNGSDILWTSTNEAFVEINGKVTTPSPDVGDQQVELKATIRKGTTPENTYELEKTFSLIVRVKDKDIADADLADLLDYLNINNDLDNITENIDLPKDGLYGSTIEWTSGNADRITADGAVTRPTHTQGDQAVTLTAVIHKGKAEVLAGFDMIVKAAEPTDAEAVAVAEKWLTNASILKENSSIENITSDLELPVKGPFGTGIEWKSSWEAVITANGKVTRQSFTLGDANVTLTATLSRGTESQDKSFTGVVKCLNQTGEEAFAADYAWLDVSHTLGDNLSQYSICGNLNLPHKAPCGSLITWASSDPDVISDSGIITRPAYEIGHKSLTITASVKNGNDAAEKVFEYTVLKIPDTDPPGMVSNSIEESGSRVILWNTKEITITFDEEITPEPGKRYSRPKDYGIILKGQDTPEIYAIHNKNKLTIGLFDYMKPGMDYELILPSGTVTDESLNNQQELRLSFSVEQKPVNIIEVVSSSPEENEKQIPDVTSQISFRYNYSSIVRGDSFYNISLLDGSGKELYTLKSLNGDTVNLDLTAGAKLQPGNVYAIVIPSGAVRDRYENKSSGRTIRFRTQDSDTTPQIVSTYPVNGQTHVNIDQQIEINFSEAIKASDCRLKLLKDDGSEFFSGIWEPNSQRTGVVIRPYGSLKPNTRYTVVGPYDSAANPSGVEFRMSFTTGADSLDIIPRPVSVDGIPLRSPIEIVFAEPVKRGPEFENIRIVDSQGNVAAFELSEMDNRAVLTPVSELSPSETYIFDIPKGAYINENNGENDTLRFRRTAAGRRDYADYSFYPSPSTDWVTGMPLTFDTKLLEEISREVRSMEWDFGDGQYGSGSNPRHTYSAEGDYDVTLTLTDAAGISYSFVQTVRVGGLAPGEIGISVYNGEHRYLTVYDQNNEYNIRNYETFSITLYSSSIGRIPGEMVRVELHKNGKKPIDLGTVTTDDNGAAEYRFWYGNKGYFGTYELVFVHELMRVKNEARVPVTISENAKRQAMVIKLYDPRTQQFLTHRRDIVIEVNGVNKYAEYESLDDGRGECYVIKDLQTGVEYSLKMAGDDQIPFVSDRYTILHSGSDNTVFLEARRKEPGINSIKSAVSDTKLSGDSIIIQGIEIPGLTFEFDGEWDNSLPGYYELTTSSGSISIKSEEPSIEFQPALEMKPGERLLVRMVDWWGRASKWMDARIMIAPKPSIGYGINVNLCYSDGVYKVDSSFGIMGLNGGSAEILDGIPMLDNSNSFGFAGDSSRLWGTMNRQGYMVLNYRDGYNAGMNTTKASPFKKGRFSSTGYEVKADIRSYYLLYYNDETREWEVLIGENYLVGRGQYYWEKGLGISGVPVKVSGKLAMGSNISGLLVFNKINGENEYSGIIGFEPFIKVSLYAGTRKLSVEGYVKGSIPAELHLPTGYMQVEPNITAGITVEYVFSSDDVYKKKIAGTHWDNGKEKVIHVLAADASEMITEPGEEDINLTLTPRNYLDRRSQSTGERRENTEGLNKTGNWENAGELIKAGSSAKLFAANAAAGFSAFGEDSTLQKEFISENVYPRAEIRLVRSGDDLYAIWTDDNPERGANNRTQIRYSVLKNGVWSEPVWLWQDGTADFSPAAAASGNGVLVAWENLKQAMPDDAGFDFYVENSEISVTESVYQADGSDVQFVTLTHDDKLDHSPRIAADQGKALLVWIKSEGLGFTLGEEMKGLKAPANSDSLLFSGWNGHTWSEASEIESGLPLIVDSNLTMHGEKALLLYTLDMDSDLNTLEDQEVCYRIYEEDSWGQAVKMTNNQVQDSNAKAVFEDGDWFIAWYRDGSIMYKPALFAEAQSFAFPSKVQEDYEIIARSGTEPLIALVYKQLDENNTRSMAAVFYDIEDGVWSDEISLRPAEGYIRSLSAAFTDDGSLNAAYTQAEVITEIVEEVEYPAISDKVDLRLLAYKPVHDLALDGEESLLLSPENPLPGTRAKIKVNVSNLGDFADKASIVIYDGNPEKGIIIGEAETVRPIPARSSEQAEIEWLVSPEDRYEYEIYAVVQSIGDVTEAVESNNRISCKLSTADIAIADLECENIAGDDYLIGATMMNRGGRLLDDVKIRLTWNGNDLDTRELGQMQAGQEISLSFLISSKDLEPDGNGEISMALCASASLPDGVQENSTDNNTYEFVLEPAAITVDKMDPAPDETRVSINKLLTLSFNMNVEAGADFDRIALTDVNLNSMEIDKTLEGNTLTVTPKSAMAYNTGYTLSIPRGALGDSYGHVMESSFSQSFTTASSSPETVFAYPGDGMGNIALNQDIRVKYNQKILEGPAIESITLNGPDAREISAAVSIQEEWLNIHPTALLGENTQYFLTIPGGAVKNDQDEVQREDFLLKFTTGEDNKYAVTFNANGGSCDTITVVTSTSGKLTILPTATKSDYSFEGWYTALAGGMRITTDTVFTSNTTVYAHWAYSGSEGSEDGNVSSDNGSGILKSPSSSKVDSAGCISAFSELDISSGNAVVHINESMLNDALNKVTETNAGKKTVEINVSAVKGAAGYDTSLPLGAFSGEENLQFRISTALATVTLPGDVLTEGQDESSGLITLSIAKADAVLITNEETRRNIGDRPVIQLSLAVDGKKIDWNNSEAPVTVAIPYVPTPMELENPEKIVIWYIDGNGSAVSVPNGVYDPVTGTVTFMTTHFSWYAVAWNPIEFNDVSEDAWYGKAVSFIAARHITMGTGNGNYSPNERLSRGEFIVLLMRAYGIAADENPTDNFQDAGNTYYTGYLAAAKRLGISSGVGNNQFAPDNRITRQEVFTLIYNALRSMNQLPDSASGKTLSQFSDSSEIAVWAKEALTLLVKNGVVNGSNGRLTPTGTTTRAEMAQVLYNLLAK